MRLNETRIDELENGKVARPHSLKPSAPFGDSSTKIQWALLLGLASAKTWRVLDATPSSHSVQFKLSLLADRNATRRFFLTCGRIPYAAIGDPNEK